MAINIRKIVRIGRVLLRAFRNYKLRFFAIVVLGFLAGLSGAFGIGTVIPIFYLLTGQEPAGLDFITHAIRNGLDFFHLPFTLPVVLACTAALFVFKGLMQFTAKYASERIYADYNNTIRTKLFQKTLRASWPYLINQKLGYLEKVLMRDVTAVSMAISQVSSIILISTSFLIYIFFALKISVPITMLTSIFGAVLFLALYPILRRIKLLHQNIRDTEKNVTHFVNENILGAKVVKTSAVEEKVIARGKRYFNQYRDDHLKIAFFNHVVGSSFEPISFAFIATLILVFSRSPSFDIASFTVIIYLIQKIFSFVQQGQSTIQSIAANVPFLQSVARYRKEASLHKEARGGAPITFTNRIAFQHVSFSYDHEKSILNDISFTVRKGEMVALIGPSGAGKTTVADLLMRLFYPTAGEITVDGKNIAKTNLVRWRKGIGYMPQDTFVLNDTIRANIAFYDSSLSDSDISTAVKMANIHDFIKTLPRGLDTVIGERGVKVSAGQRQRIMLARTLIQNPSILILDEATSALDSQSELMIQKAIEKLRGNVTLLVIAHRLSTIMNADTIIALENGKVTEQGTPDQLIANRDSYLYRSTHEVR